MKVTIDTAELTYIRDVIRKEDLPAHWKKEQKRGWANMYKNKEIHGWLFRKPDDKQVRRLVISTAAIWRADNIIREILEQNGYTIICEWFGPAGLRDIPDDEICYTFYDIDNKLTSIEMEDLAKQQAAKDQATQLAE